MYAAIGAIGLTVLGLVCLMGMASGAKIIWDNLVKSTRYKTLNFDNVIMAAVGLCLILMAVVGILMVITVIAPG